MPRKPLVEATALVVANDATDVEPFNVEGVILDETTLDAAVVEAKGAINRAKANVIELGAILARIHGSKLWTLRAGESGPRHKSWSAFVRAELDLSVASANSYITIAQTFTKADVLAHGVSKLRLVASVPEGEQPRVLASIKAGATREQTAAEVREIKARTSYQKPSIGKAVPHNAGKAKKPRTEPLAPTSAQLPEPLKTTPKTDAGADDEQLDDLHRHVMRVANEWKGKTYAPVVAVLRKIVETLEARDRAKEPTR
jgi:hypothetical protein